MKTIFLAESERHVLEALHFLIEQETGMRILGEARSAEALLVQVCQHAPDVILLDWNLTGLHPQRLIHALRECCPSAKLLAISVKPEDEKAAMEYGLEGFLSKQLSPGSFLISLKSILGQVKSDQENS